MSKGGLGKQRDVDDDWDRTTARMTLGIHLHRNFLTTPTREKMPTVSW